MKHHKLFHWIVRLVCLVGAVVLALGGPVPSLLARVLPGLSPLLVLAHSLAGRSWYVGLFWGLPPLAVLLAAVWKGRIFCRWVCPAGTLFATAAACKGRKRFMKVRLGGVVFWMIVAGAIIGFPLWISMDPLSSFNRLTPLFRGTYAAASLIPGLIVPIFLLLGVFQPFIWCFHFCPLGYLFDLCHFKAPKPVWKRDETRRHIVLGLALGVPLALAAKKLAPLAPSGPALKPILPPGAADPQSFASLCSRCYACVNVCPTRVIKVKMPLGKRLGQFFHPELDTERTYCEEHCNQCSQVCPAGAIRPLTLDQKRSRQIGRANVIKKACLAWEDGEHCMVCQEFCPYFAIEASESPAGIPRPVVKPEVCRGCGACQSECPAVRMGKAIIVEGIEKQGQAIDA